jgi:uncharacterized protein YoxC
MDALLQELNRVSILLLPILGVIVLIFIAVLLKRFLETIKRLNSTVEKLNHTIDTVDQVLVDIEKPVQTLVNIATTVDMVNSATVNLVKGAISGISANMSAIKSWFSNRFSHKEEEEVNQDPIDNE